MPALHNGVEMDLMSSVMLVCAVAASLAIGVLVAYGICQVMFRAFRLHAASEGRNRERVQVGVPAEAR